MNFKITKTKYANCYFYTCSMLNLLVLYTSWLWNLSYHSIGIFRMVWQTQTGPSESSENNTWLYSLLNRQDHCDWHHHKHTFQCCNTTNVTSGAGTTYPSEHLSSPPVFSKVSNVRSSVFCVVFYTSLFVHFLSGIVLAVILPFYWFLLPLFGKCKLLLLSKAWASISAPRSTIVICPCTNPSELMTQTVKDMREEIELFRK